MNISKIIPVPLGDAKIKSGFIKNYMEIARTQMIPYQWEALNDRIDGAEKSHWRKNFEIAAGLSKGEFEGWAFQDSDGYKWLEAVAYSLMWHPDSKLEQTADEAIDLIAKAQQADGYLDTFYIINGLDQRFTNLRDKHELYCLGHLIEAAVAYYKATGKNKLLTIAIRFVDCARAHIGPEEGRLKGYPGHEVIEMALISLYRITNKKSYLDYAEYFINQRGQSPLFFEEERIRNKNKIVWDGKPFLYKYYQVRTPVREQEQAEGHAVRAVYLYSGMADVAAETGDQELLAACEKLWNSIVLRQMYVTGGIGSSWYGEAFTFDYDLPNDTIYAETCAAVGLMFFARRMFELTGHAKYADIMERVLYNGVLSGMSLDGRSFFYVNPLEVDPIACENDHYKQHVKPARQKWFGCACCPPNVARLIASIAGYAYEGNMAQNLLYINLFFDGEITTRLGSQDILLTVETNYPWEGSVKIVNQSPTDSEFELAVRIPDWCKGYTLRIDGQVINGGVVENGYLKTGKLFGCNSVLEIEFAMPGRIVSANPHIRENIGKAAIMRGPLVYCLEQEDNGMDLYLLRLRSDEPLVIHFDNDFLGGIAVITTKGERISMEGWDEEILYQSYLPEQYMEQALKFIPYYAWANRSIGQMCVWIRMK